MQGLKPQHHGYLNGIVDATFKERRRIFADFRLLYKDNPLALEEIDTYDDKSKYRKHIIIYKNALKEGDKRMQEREEEWFSRHYPLSSQNLQANNFS